jgi:hypothetical protein
VISGVAGLLSTEHDLTALWVIRDEAAQSAIGA